VKYVLLFKEEKKSRPHNKKHSFKEVKNQYREGGVVNLDDDNEDDFHNIDNHRRNVHQYR
jgi:hypothetical protein